MRQAASPESGQSTAARLDAGLIVTTALDVMHEVGLDGLTMRRLADRLGVQAPALYWHFRNKRALLDAMLDRLLTGNLEAPVAGEDSGAWLDRIGHDLRSSLCRYRDAARLMTQVQITPRMIEERLPRFYDGLRRMGMDGREVLYTSIAFVAFIVGWVQTEENMQNLMASSDESQDQPQPGQTRLAMTGFDPQELDATFKHGLTLMIEGCRAFAQGRATA